MSKARKRKAPQGDPERVTLYGEGEYCEMIMACLPDHDIWCWCVQCEKGKIPYEFRVRSASLDGAAFMVSSDLAARAMFDEETQNARVKITAQANEMLRFARDGT